VCFQFISYERFNKDQEWVDILGNIVSASSLTGIFGYIIYSFATSCNKDALLVSV